MKVVIFTEGYRPFYDHFYGLMQSACKAKDLNFYIFINKIQISNNDLFIEKYKSFKNIKFYKDDSLLDLIRIIYGDYLIIGSPKNYLKIFILFAQLLNRGIRRIIIHPGNVLKASGIYKSRYKFLPNLIKFYLINLLFPYKLLTATDVLRVYFFSAFAYPIRTLLVFPLPKHIYINSKLKKAEERNVILISPTHRWENQKSPLEDLLEKQSFINKLERIGFSIKYTIHPHFSSKMITKALSFQGNWSEVAALITDYSSIGYDYIYSGGKNLIYYIPDIQEFEKNQGHGPLFEMHAKNYFVAHKKENIYKYLEQLKGDLGNEPKVKSVPYANNYYEGLISKIYNRKS